MICCNIFLKPDSSYANLRLCYFPQVTFSPIVKPSGGWSTVWTEVHCFAFSPNHIHSFKFTCNYLINCTFQFTCSLQPDSHVCLIHFVQLASTCIHFNITCDNIQPQQFQFSQSAPVSVSQHFRYLIFIWLSVRRKSGDSGTYRFIQFTAQSVQLVSHCLITASIDTLTDPVFANYCIHCALTQRQFRHIQLSLSPKHLSPIYHSVHIHVRSDNIPVVWL